MEDDIQPGRDPIDESFATGAFDDSSEVVPPEFPGPSEGNPDPAPPLCPGCDQPMVWNRPLKLWQCHSGGPAFVDEDGIQIDIADVPHIDCELCGEWAARHAEGCPAAAPDKALCGECGELMPVRELAAHMNDYHDANLSQEQVESSFVEAKEMARGLLDGGLQNFLRDRMHAAMEGSSHNEPMLVEIWAAIGHQHVTGEWPDSCGFTPEAAVQTAMKNFSDAAERANALLDELLEVKRHYGLDPETRFEAIDLMNLPTPDGFEWDEKNGWWHPHCPYGCDGDGPCPHRPRDVSSGDA